VLLAGLAGVQPVVGQVRPDPVPSVQAGDVVALAVGAALAVTPRVFGWGPDRSPCAPCDPARLPAVDRWAVRDPRPAWGLVSWLALGGLAVVSIADVAAEEGSGPYLTAMAEAVVWTNAATEMLKAGVGRPRPVLYTPGAAEAATDRENLRSFPSGHTSTAFAIATAYWLARRDLDGTPGAAAWAAAGAAATVGLLRILAGKHFTTDVLAGALLGIAGGAAVHVIKF